MLRSLSYYIKSYPYPAFRVLGVCFTLDLVFFLTIFFGVSFTASALFPLLASSIELRNSFLFVVFPTISALLLEPSISASSLEFRLPSASSQHEYDSEMSNASTLGNVSM
uniref:(northern house mosquito) hypothetical protein n=1 Tax=Culex pipiens TaxID=7175 RepID=A0A8D8ER39_CULPI